MPTHLRSPALAMLAGAGSLFLLAGCGGAKKADPNAGKPPKGQARAVYTTKVLVQDAPRYLDEIGTCSAVESVNVQAQVTGQITERRFADGADVKKGDVLFIIDQRP